MEEVQIRDEKVDEPLARDELKVLRKYVGKLNWLPNLFVCFEVWLGFSPGIGCLRTLSGS